jgi:hypothetical protein
MMQLILALALVPQPEPQDCWSYMQGVTKSTWKAQTDKFGGCIGKQLNQEEEEVDKFYKTHDHRTTQIPIRPGYNITMCRANLIPTTDWWDYELRRWGSCSVNFTWFQLERLKQMQHVLGY